MIQSTTSTSSTYSHSGSSQHDPSSPQHLSANAPPSESINNATMYTSNSAVNSSTRESVDQSSLNAPHQFRTSTAFNPAYSTNSSVFSNHPAFSPVASSPGVQQQMQPHQPQPQPQAPQRPFRTDLPSTPSYPSHFGSSPSSAVFPTKADVFGTSQPLDGFPRFDYDAFGDVPANSTQHGHTQSSFGQPPPKHNGVFSSALLQSHPVQVSKMAQQQQPQGPQSYISNGVPYLNGGGHGQHAHAPPHTQASMNGMYGPPTMHHAPGPGPGPGPVQTSQHQTQSGRGEQQQEEISTIFVVGFPEDMHEREFQNMFTFSVGFEAATLKIPNKDSSAYGPATGSSGAANSLRQGGYLPASSHPQQGGTTQYAGSQDPYNLVTVNSGGVVVDGPQGTSSSWQQPSDQYGGDGAPHAQPPAMPPRKQIIGFAKFRTRQEALDARDVLQGRRVDIEKGAVLKAEMAKKNLHTKRGVGPLGLPLGLMGVGGGVVAPEMLAGVPGLNGFAAVNAATTAPPPVQADALSQRDKELGVLGAMGLGGISRRSIQEDEKERREREMAIQRPRDEEERRRKEKELERNNKLRMNNTTLYDAFHSVPIGTRSGPASGGTPSAPLSSGGYTDGGNGFPGYTFQNNVGGNGLQQMNGNGNGNSGPNGYGTSSFQNNAFSPQDTFNQSGSAPWGLPNKPATDLKLPPRPPSSRQSSPPSTTYDVPFSTAPGRALYSGSDSSTFSPPDPSVPLPPIGPRPRAHSPTLDVPQYHASSSSSSVTGSQSSLEGEFSRTLTVSTHQGTTSPQLPSPGSGGSSNNARQSNVSDQNPPINTLYVGNLPNSPVPTGYPPSYLEDSLRALFSRCPGYRKLCFRQKSNGPMCFVEFEDVSHATKALNDLYGNQLNGLVKGGIRLSFSKNPLGVRPTPLNANNAQASSRRETGRDWNGHVQPTLQQQQPQQQQHPNMAFSMHDAFHSRGTPSQQTQVTLEIGSNRQQARHDHNDVSSPNVYNYTTSPPPSSRFFSPPPSSSQSSLGGMTASSATSVSFPRFQQTSAGFSATPNSPPFSQEGDERMRLRAEQPPHAFSPSPGIETTRAG